MLELAPIAPAPTPQPLGSAPGAPEAAGDSGGFADLMDGQLQQPASEAPVDGRTEPGDAADENGAPDDEARDAGQAIAGIWLAQDWAQRLEEPRAARGVTTVSDAAGVRPSPDPAPGLPLDGADPIHAAVEPTSERAQRGRAGMEAPLARADRHHSGIKPASEPTQHSRPGTEPTLDRVDRGRSGIETSLERADHSRPAIKATLGRDDAAPPGHAAATPRTVQEPRLPPAEITQSTEVQDVAMDTSPLSKGADGALAVGAVAATAASGGTPAVRTVASAPAVYVATPVDDAQFAGALAVQVSVLARDGVQEASLHLHPAEMGPVAVQIAMEGNRAHINFVAAVDRTCQLLEDSLAQLGAALQDAGLSFAGGGVFHQSADPGHGQATSPAPTRDGAEPSAADVVAQPGSRPLQPRGMVDLVA